MSPSRAPLELGVVTSASSQLEDSLARFELFVGFNGSSAHHLLMNFEEPLKDYVHAVQSIKFGSLSCLTFNLGVLFDIKFNSLVCLLKQATLAERTNAFRQQCELAETIKLKEIDMNKLRLTRSEKFPEAEHDYEVMKADSEEATRRFEMIVRLMKDEIVRFQEQKTLDMGLAVHEFAKGQAHLANSIADAWRSRLPKLEGCSSS
ncbi:sorting nexin 1-like [Actinidia eriantha]|uniref:sorting nexin 1-like n=1 Tax=Actinidia eriantha TaxID=165200 RepID=UPI002586AFD4|nr:sorting nexin 1-like [Actinidia eriantha]